jgi:hypothetical protein
MSVGRPRVIVKRQSEDAPIIEVKRSFEPKRDNSMMFLDQVAQSTTCQMNHKWMCADSDFPNEPWMRTVRFYYPYAVGGPLLVDELVMHHQLAGLKRKEKCLRERGFRYFIFRRQMSITDAMMELEKCLGQPLPQN